MCYGEEQDKFLDILHILMARPETVIGDVQRKKKTNMDDVSFNCLVIIVALFPVFPQPLGRSYPARDETRRPTFINLSPQ